MNPLDQKMNRRNFIGAVGGACAVLSAAAFAKSSDSSSTSSAQRKPLSSMRKTVKKNVAEGTMQKLETDVLVVGGGMAGVFAAVKAHDNGARVLLVDKGSVGRSGQTPFARGIFSYNDKTSGMSKTEYLAKTAAAAEQMNNPIYTRLLLDQSAGCVDELRSWGFFKEVTYAKALNRPLEKRKIPVVERVMLTHLLKEGGRVVGAAGLYIDQNESVVIHAKSVILCTGASGFKPTGWQIGSLTSDGDAMAYRIGAEITGKEWIDGHGMANPGLEGLAKTTSPGTEEIRGMLGVEMNIDVEKNGPSTSMMMGPPGGGPPGGGSGEDRPQGPPPGGGSGGHGGPPMGASMGGCSAGMAIHKAEGLFPQNDKCASNIPGLYAAGDSLGSMQTGGIYTQVGSSLAGSAVQGALAGKTAAEYAKGVSQKTVSDSRLKLLNTEIYAPYLRQRGFSAQWVTQTLQGIMIPNFILYVKSEERLRSALTYIEHLRDHQVPLLMADDLHELRQCHETTNMVLNAEMKLRASLMRTESRGSHYREDYPARDDKNWLCWIKIKQASDGSMKLLKQAV
jgi:succinate dehydrogenase/fumarate reductase flavoprotein subunit